MHRILHDQDVTELQSSITAFNQDLRYRFHLAMLLTLFREGTTDILTGQNVELSWIDIIATHNTIQQGIHLHLTLYKALN